MKKIVLLLAFFAIGLNVLVAQTREVTGKVTSADDGGAIPGVSVSVKGTSLGTITDVNGNFALKITTDTKTLVFSFVGLATEEVVIGTQSTINVQLKSENISVDEVMVVAYGTSKKSSFTGSAGVVSSEKLETRTITSVTQALEGSTTGVQVTSSGQPGSSPDVRIRGYGTLNGVADPLFIVDGAQYEGSMANISPDDIESMTILKDASSTALYGARAANGCGHDYNKKRPGFKRRRFN